MDDALARAVRTAATRRAVVALIRGVDTQWWGGSIDDWHPDETLLSSPSSLEAYRKLLRQFKSGGTARAHAVMVYSDGSFASVMFGVKTRFEVAEFFKEASEIVRVRSTHAWLRA